MLPPCDTMNVLINRIPHTLPEGATVADAVAAIAARAPFAVAVNTRFVPQSRYTEQRLQPGDEVVIIAPVSGG